MKKIMFLNVFNVKDVKKNGKVIKRDFNKSTTVKLGYNELGYNEQNLLSQITI